MVEKLFFYILIRAWNSFEYFDRCIDSALSQKYKNFQILFVDDATPLDQKQKKYISRRLKNHITVFNKKRLHSLRNAYEMIRKYAVNPNAVVFNLDGDDWLLGRHALSSLAMAYSQNTKCLLTYGECLLWNGAKLSEKPSDLLLPNTNVPYSKKIIRENSYRFKPFYPLHPRTWRVWLFKKIKKQDFLRPDGSWLQFAEDQAMFYPMLEMAGGNFLSLKKPVYVHNFDYKYSDLKANLYPLVKDELIIRKKPRYEPLQ